MSLIVGSITRGTRGKMGSVEKEVGKAEFTVHKKQAAPTQKLEGKIAKVIEKAEERKLRRLLLLLKLLTLK